MFVKRTVRKRGDKEYEYLSLVEAVRENGKNTHRTLLRLGEVSELRDSGQLDRIVKALSAYAAGSYLDATALSGEGAPSFGGMAAVRAYFCRLGLDRHFAAVGTGRRSAALADTVFAMVANRLLQPSSKRRTITEWLATVALPDGVVAPSLDQCYRATDALAAAKERTESHLYARLTDLTNLDLRLCCYDLTSSYFETAAVGAARFPSLAFGYSRDKRPDRPQVVIGLLVTGDGIPVAHHVFAGNTADVTTLPRVMADLQDRFGVGRIALVADRGLISEANLEAVGEAGFDHVLATRLHRDEHVEAVLRAATAPGTAWSAVPEAKSFCAEVVRGGRRYVVVFSPLRFLRDRARENLLLERAEDGLLALARRVHERRLADPAKIGAAADRVLRDSGVGRCFKVTVREGFFSFDYDRKALAYDEELLCGRYVLTTSLTLEQASATDVVRHYRSLQRVERRFRVLKDFLALRPVFHWTEERVHGHVALCVLGATIEAVMGKDLAAADVRDPDLRHQQLTPRRALAELKEVRRCELAAGERRLAVVTRRSALQAKVLSAFAVDTSGWDKAAIA